MLTAGAAFVLCVPIYLLGALCVRASALPKDSFGYLFYAPGIRAIDAVGRFASASVGVVLMVCVTVVLAVIIGTFVLDLGQTVEPTVEPSFENIETIDVRTDFEVRDGGRR